VAEFAGTVGRRAATLVPRQHLDEAASKDIALRVSPFLRPDGGRNVLPYWPVQGSYGLLNLLAQGLDEVEAVGGLPSTFSLEPMAVTADDRHLRV
jgi:hypothetical protein